jgi:predicted CopG family antitoxin
MKSLYIVFEDEEFEKLKKAKGELSWHDFVLSLVEKVKK